MKVKVLNKEFAIDWEWFRNLWHANADEYEFFELVKKINQAMTFSEFDEGWQYHTVLNSNFNVAKDEFINVLMGCY